MNPDLICENKPYIPTSADKKGLKEIYKSYHNGGMGKCLGCLGDDLTCGKYRPNDSEIAERFEKAIKGTLVASVI